MPHGHAGVCHQTSSFGLQHAQEFSVVQLLYRGESVNQRLVLHVLTTRSSGQARDRQGLVRRWREAELACACPLGEQLPPAVCVPRAGFTAASW